MPAPDSTGSKIITASDKPRPFPLDPVLDPLTLNLDPESESVSDPESETDPETETRKFLSPAALQSSTIHKNPNTDPFTDPNVTERAGRFLEKYQELYPAQRNGARYAARPARDYAAAVTLCQTWPDDERLEKLAICFLTTDHKFAEEGSRTIPQFLALASWCDGKLSEWEKSNGNGARH